jgi:hypothetical protein
MRKVPESDLWSEPLFVGDRFRMGSEYVRDQFDELPKTVNIASVKKYTGNVDRIIEWIDDDIHDFFETEYDSDSLDWDDLKEKLIAWFDNQDIKYYVASEEVEVVWVPEIEVSKEECK